MKRIRIKSILCSLLIAALLVAPMSALAAPRVAYILKVSVPSSSGTYVRAGSGSGANEIIGSLRNGTKVLYWGEKSGQMLKVMGGNGAIGYIYQGHLKTYGAMNIKQLYRTSSATALYKRSGSSLKRAGTVGKGTPVIVYALRDGWAYVRSISGAGGYVKKSALKRVA